MHEIEALMRDKARELLAAGTVRQIFAWRPGEFWYDNAPAAFTSAEACDKIVYNEFCPANLSKMLIAASKSGIKTGVFLKPCDTYGLNQLLKDHRVTRELVHVVGTPCCGMLDIKKIRAAGAKGIKKITVHEDEVLCDTVYGSKSLKRQDVYLDKCLHCKGCDYMIADETIGEPLPVLQSGQDPFAEVKRIEALPPRKRFAFWQEELSKCIRCNTCRDVCPACSCEQCIFDNPDAPVAGKANADRAEEQAFHIIRAFHVAGRCVDCGECERCCPQGIKLRLLNLKFIKDINSFYGAYQAGEDLETVAPQFTYKPDDPEANEAAGRRF